MKFTHGGIQAFGISLFDEILITYVIGFEIDISI